MWKGGRLEAGGTDFGFFLGMDGQEAVGNGFVDHGPRHEIGAFVGCDEAAPALPCGMGAGEEVTPDQPSFTYAAKASAQSGCQRESGGRFCVMSPAAQAMRFSSSARGTSLSGQRM